MYINESNTLQETEKSCSDTYAVPFEDKISNKLFINI